MPRTPLGPEQIRTLIGLLQDLFAHQEAVRRAHPLAALIQFPKVPPALTESLALHLINSGSLLGHAVPGVRAELSTSGGDIAVHQPQGPPLRVEVKGTAGSAFQHFGSKDIEADVLVWIHFGSCFRDQEERIISAYILLEPKRFFPRQGRVTLSRFLEVAGSYLFSRQFDVGSLEPLSDLFRTG